MIVLIPMSCWKTASPIATSSAGRTHAAPSSRSPPPSSSRSTSWISSISSSGLSSAWVASSTSLASSSSPLRTRKRGVSGIQIIPTSSTSDGTTARPSITRQASEEASTALTR